MKDDDDDERHFLVETAFTKSPCGDIEKYNPGGL